MKSVILPLLVATFAVGGCVSAPSPTEQRMAAGAAGGAVLGQVLGGNTRSTLGGAALGAIVAGATAPNAAQPVTRTAPAANPCADLYAKYPSNPDLAGDLCEMRAGRL